MADWDDAGDGGWGNDAGGNAGGGGGDDDWGKGGGDDGGDDWGKGDVDVDGNGKGGKDKAGGSGGNGGNDKTEELSIEVQIENAFYEADDLRRDSPSEALVHFKKVLDLSKQVDRLEDETLGFVFKSIRYMVSIYLEMKKLNEMTDTYRTLLSYVPKVTRNEGQEAVNAVLHDVDDYPDTGFVAQIYRETSETLRKMTDQERLWFKVNMRYCELCFERAEYKEASEMLQALKKSCQFPDGQDDPNKGSELLEIYALEMTMSNATQDTAKLKELYEKTKNLTAAVKDPKTQSVIRECWGQMFGNQGDWSQAYSEFFKAFNSYQEIGHRQKTIQCLKYVIISNMLSGSSTNPFDSREAKPLQNDKKIEPYDALRVAYERTNVQKFSNALDAILKDGDAFIKKHLDNMVRDFHQKAIKDLIKAYRRVRLDFLAQTLRISVSQVESLLIQLILDNEIVGNIDQIKGLLDLTQSVSGGARYIAIDRWASTVNNLRQNIPTPAFR